jgi:hypothetical protein
MVYQVYRLVATRGEQRSETRFESDSDGHAMMDALPTILDRAAHSQLWALGRIELFCGDRLVDSMEAKG